MHNYVRIVSFPAIYTTETVYWNRVGTLSIWKELLNDTLRLRRPLFSVLLVFLRMCRWRHLTTWCPCWSTFAQRHKSVGRLGAQFTWALRKIQTLLFFPLLHKHFISVQLCDVGKPDFGWVLLEAWSVAFERIARDVIDVRFVHLQVATVALQYSVHDDGVVEDETTLEVGRQELGDCRRSLSSVRENRPRNGRKHVTLWRNRVSWCRVRFLLWFLWRCWWCRSDVTLRSMCALWTKPVSNVFLVDWSGFAHCLKTRCVWYATTLFWKRFEQHCKNFFDLIMYNLDILLLFKENRRPTLWNAVT